MGACSWVHGVRLRRERATHPCAPYTTPGNGRYEIAAENKRLSEPLARALKEVEVLRGGALASADKDNASLAQTKERLEAAVKQVGVFGGGVLWRVSSLGLVSTCTGNEGSVPCKLRLVAALTARRHPAAARR
jgi:hypothetical protein